MSSRNKGKKKSKYSDSDSDLPRRPKSKKSKVRFSVLMLMFNVTDYIILTISMFPDQKLIIKEMSSYFSYNIKFIVIIAMELIILLFISIGCCINDFSFAIV